MKAQNRGRWSRIVAVGAVALVLTGFERASANPTDDAYNNCMGTARAKPETLISACTKVIALGGNHPAWLAVAYQNRGTAYLIEGQLDAALSDLNAAVRLGPDYALAFAHRSVAWRLEGDMAKALKDADEAVHLDPLDLVVRRIRGELFLERDEPTKAIADFEAILHRDPGSEMGMTGLANAYRLENDNQRALALYTEAITKYPKNFVPRLGRGYVHMNLQDWDSAIADFQEAESLKPALYQAYEGIADAYERKDNLASSLDAWNQAISIEPRNVNALNARCWLRGRLGQDLDLALSDCDRAITIVPSDGRVHDSRALILYKLRRFREAIAEDDISLSGSSPSAGEYFLRAAAKSRNGDPNGAAKDFATARKLDPSVEAAYAGYGVTIARDSVR